MSMGGIQVKKKKSKRREVCMYQCVKGIFVCERRGPRKHLTVSEGRHRGPVAGRLRKCGEVGMSHGVQQDYPYNVCMHNGCL